MLYLFSLSYVFGVSMMRLEKKDSVFNGFDPFMLPSELRVLPFDINNWYVWAKSFKYLPLPSYVVFNVAISYVGYSLVRLSIVVKKRLALCRLH